MPNLRKTLLLLALAAPLATAQQPLLLGTAWYPEQWPESRWDADLTLMQQAHMHVVRITEFAWSTMEPSDNHFNFDWLDRAIALATKHDIKVVLGTPSAAPPAWLTQKYPETLRVEEDGRRAEHGNRAQGSATDTKYRELSARIAREMARRYGHNPNVLGWQIDNEIGAPTFDPTAVAQWHAWLAAKYKTIAELNRRWSTSYWSQTYDSFDQVPFESRNENPGLLLDYKRFTTDVWTSYVQNQVDAIRPLALPTQFITTNTMHWYPTYNHYVMHKNLDLAAWDDYVPEGHLDPFANAASHDLVRGYKQRNFWLMETQPAFVNWGGVNVALPPGVTREMAWQVIGHGADAVLYWQWRSALGGQEQYHGTLLGADGLPVPVYAEIKQLGEDFEKVNAALGTKAGAPSIAPYAMGGSTVHSSVALLNDYDSRWAIDFQEHNNKFDYVTEFNDIYRALSQIPQFSGNSCDILPTSADLATYPLVIAPSLNVLPEATAQHLLEYVRQGGHLVLTARSGMKDFDNALDPRKQPGPLAAALGATVAQYYALDKPIDILASSGGSAAQNEPGFSPGAATGTATIWAEVLAPVSPNANIDLTYGPNAGWLASKPAAITTKLGKGQLTYLGANLDQTALTAFLTQQLAQTTVQPILPSLPVGVELMQRTAPTGARVWIIINHANTPETLPNLPSGTDLLTSTTAAPTTLPPHQVVVWSLK